MKWIKVGRLFDPTKYSLSNGCTEFAQAPQTLVFDDFVRIYFSTRRREGETGKYLSYISFVDMDRFFSRIIRISTDTVIELGDLGCFDEHGIFPLNVVRDGEKILAFIGGWQRKASVSIETSIGMAISEDNGLTFRRIGNGPVLTSSLNEPFLIGDPFVMITNDLFHMWYIYGVRWLVHVEDDTPQRVYKIGHAVSRDGVDWEKAGRQLIADRLNPDECQALPTVIFHDDRYHMFFCYRPATDFRKIKKRGYRLGYAYSFDLAEWCRDDDSVGMNVSEKGWDSDMLCYPHVFHCEDRICMLYNGNEFGRFGFGLAFLDY